MNYFFVAQGQTYQTEHSQKYLWAPKDNIWHHQLMLDVKKGDAIIQYNGDLVGIAFATNDCRSSSRPNSGDFTKWKEIGFRVDVEQWHFITKVKKDLVKQDLIRCQPEHHAPFNKNGGVNQGYLFKANIDMVKIILQAAADIDSSPEQIQIIDKIKENLDIMGDTFSNNPNIDNNNQIQNSWNTIFYGAPGTGKSFTIKKQTEGRKIIRTTFHPDSDYASFVGCYKPTTIEVPMRDVTTGKVIQENGKDVTENRIIYKFVAQSFLQAYKNAWILYAIAAKEEKQPEAQYLIIEEINRGNCAQIFGDLFQLLDRDDAGFSEYPIEPDEDIKKYLEAAFKKDMPYLNAPDIYGMNYSGETAVKIRNGEILALPSNLYILATMNTSDQSLFPIDSAFKRRWDWHYVPIFDAKKNWKIEANDNLYDWWSFLEKINERIGATTNSEDKKLGYFFCKADENGIISAEKFVNKVIFYLWNDVFKDYGFDDAIFKDEDGDKLSFNNFYYVDEDRETKVQEDKVEIFLKNLGLKADTVEQNQ